MIGFYITNKGRELLTSSTTTTDKLTITKVCFGSGGDSVSQPNLDITELNNQIYEKDFNPAKDTYSVDLTDLSQICIKTYLDGDITGTINEVGYKDSSDNLIIYGVIKDVEKPQDQEILFENWIKFENSDIDKIEIKLQSPETQQIYEQLSSIKSTISEFETTIPDYESRISNLETLLDGLQEALERLA